MSRPCSRNSPRSNATQIGITEPLGEAYDVRMLIGAGGVAAAEAAGAAAPVLAGALAPLAGAGLPAAGALAGADGDAAGAQLTSTQITTVKQPRILTGQDRR